MTLTVATWNVNSIRARSGAVLRWLGEKRPDVLCMQETRVQDDQFPAAGFEELGYRLVLNGQKGRNGVAIASVFEPEDVTRDLPSGFPEGQKRLVTATVAGLSVTCVYVPNGGEVGHERFIQKLLFLEELGDYAVSAGRGLPVLVAGDFNVAPGVEDVWDPEGLDGTVCYHPEERRRLREIIDRGMTDLYRVFSPGGKAYSWWDYRAAGFRRDLGMRLDLILADGTSAEMASGCWIDREPRGWDRPSDHTPVLASFSVPGNSPG